MAASPESTSPAENPMPEDEVLESFTHEDVLWFVRNEAARRDPALAHLYRRMDASRVKDGVDVVLALIQAHRDLVGRWGRRARTGKRKHAQRVYALLASTNEANLVLAEAYLFSAYATLPPSRSQHDD
jgi:hypothetical protein